MLGAPGWLSRLSIRHWLRSRSQCPGAESQVRLPAQREVCFSLCFSFFLRCSPLLVISHSLSIKLKKKKHNYKCCKARDYLCGIGFIWCSHEHTGTQWTFHVLFPTYVLQGMWFFIIDSLFLLENQIREPENYIQGKIIWYFQYIFPMLSGFCERRQNSNPIKLGKFESQNFR